MKSLAVPYQKAVGPIEKTNRFDFSILKSNPSISDHDQDDLQLAAVAVKPAPSMAAITAALSTSPETTTSPITTLSTSTPGRPARDCLIAAPQPPGQVMPSTLNTTGVVAGEDDVESLVAVGGDSAGAQPRLMAPHVATRAIARTERVFRMIGTPKTKQNPRRLTGRMLVSPCPASPKSTG